jgi:hypothetical protein
MQNNIGRFIPLVVVVLLQTSVILFMPVKPGMGGMRFLFFVILDIVMLVLALIQGTPNTRR